MGYGVPINNREEQERLRVLRKQESGRQMLKMSRKIVELVLAGSACGDPSIFRVANLMKTLSKNQKMM
jgi:hypothetical protein